MSRQQTLLVVAVTGRAIAHSAVRGGFSVVLLDYFADRDAAMVARTAHAVAPAGSLRFARRSLLRLARECAPPGGGSGLVFGAGFEGAPSLLARLAAGRELLGNRPEVVAHVRDPARFFPLLDRLGIPHPEIRRTAPGDPDQWLLKRSGGAGGAHIRVASRRAPPRDGYYQRRAPGEPHSVLFLADGRRARIVGTNRQWTAGGDPERPFLYGGAVGGIVLPPRLAAALPGCLDRLVAATGLVGLNGLDFLLDGDRWAVLELNPRPTATLDLHDPDHPRGLIALHVAACRGALPAAVPARRTHRAHAVVLAPAALEVTPQLEFPGGCRDLPVVGTRLSAGDPCCTVHAEGASVAEALAGLGARRAALEASLRSHALAPAG